MGEFKDIVVLIPAYKPSSELAALVPELFETGFSNIVVVDDGSGEDFADVFGALPASVILLSHPRNQGKGSALKTGLSYIEANVRDCLGVITCDADGQHTPDDIGKVAKGFVADGARSLVLGSRTFQGDVPRRSAFGNRITRGVFYLAGRVRLNDTQTGLRAFPFRMIPALLSIPGNRYEYEMNMLLDLAKRGESIVEVEIRTIYLNGNESSHFRTIRDSAVIYGNILRFSLSSLACLGIDFAALFLLRLWTKELHYGASLFISVLCARLISSFMNYHLNRRLVFRRDGNRALPKYYALAACVMGLNYLLLYVSSTLLAVPLFWAKLAADLLLFVLSYGVQKRWIFNKGRPA